MPHNKILHNYIKRTCIKKGKDFDNFITLSLLFKRYTSMINNLNRRLMGEQAKVRKLESEVSRLNLELDQSDRIINQLEEQNDNLKKNLTL